MGRQPIEGDVEGGWEARGTTEGVESITQGTCGGGSGQHIYAFTAPEAGRYAINVSGDTFSPLGFATVYVRSSCPEVETELGCDARREPNASTSVRLFADQTVYIFVDGILGERFPSTGGYHLRIFRTAPPELESAEAWMNRTTGSTSIDLRGFVGSGHPSGLVYRFFDEAGEVIPSRGRNEPQRFGLVFETMAGADERESFSGTLDFAADIPNEQIGSVSHVDVAVTVRLGSVVG